MGLSQKYPGAALITGASSGIGKAFAERLAAEGMDLVLVARRTKRLQSIRLDLASRFPVRVDIINADLIEPLSTEYILEYLDQQQISVSMLFNNAGISHLGPFATSDIGIYERMVSLHCTAPVRLTHAILNRFPESLKAIITTSSLAGILPTPYLSVYSATKAFLTAWSYTLSEELSEQGIAVLSLNPGGSEHRDP
jgi:short-subunit dehydrogenase